MIKAFIIQYKTYFYSALAAGLFMAGWSVNGWRLNSKIESMKADHAHKVLETERTAHDVVMQAEALSLKNIEAVRRERDNALQSLKKLRGVTIDSRIVGVLSHYTKTTGSPADVTDNSSPADTTYDAEEQTRIILENYAKFNECREQVIGWGQFYDSLLKEFNK